MWQTNKPEPVKLIFGILAANETCLAAATETLIDQFGQTDLQSEVWPFFHTEYYKDEMGTDILRQFLSFKKLIDPGDLAEIKHKANQLEETLAGVFAKKGLNLPRPINLDPGTIELAKLILASTKNFSHRVYIGQSMYAEVTLSYCRGKWQDYPYTFADYKQQHYHDFFSKVRGRLAEQLKQKQ